MKQINWKIRFKNPAFIMGLLSTVILLGQQIATLLGVDFPEALSEEIMSIAKTALSIMATLGVLVDPTTKGTKDSERALGYEELGK